MKGMIGNGDGKLFLTTFKDRERQEQNAEREIIVPVGVEGWWWWWWGWRRVKEVERKMRDDGVKG